MYSNNHNGNWHRNNYRYNNGNNRWISKRYDNR